MNVLLALALLLATPLHAADEGGLPDPPADPRFPRLEDAEPVPPTDRTRMDQRFLRRQRFARWTVYGTGASALLLAWGTGAMVADVGILGNEEPGPLARTGQVAFVAGGVGLLLAPPLVTFGGLWANQALYDTGGRAGSWSGRLAIGLMFVASPLVTGNSALWALAAVPASIQVLVNEHGWRREQRRRERVALVPTRDGVALIGLF